MDILGWVKYIIKLILLLHFCLFNAATEKFKITSIPCIIFLWAIAALETQKELTSKFWLGLELQSATHKKIMSIHLLVSVVVVKGLMRKSESDPGDRKLHWNMCRARIKLKRVLSEKLFTQWGTVASCTEWICLAMKQMGYWKLYKFHESGTKVAVVTNHRDSLSFVFYQGKDFKVLNQKILL